VVSFVIPTRNRPEELARTLRGLARLDLPAGAEAIVIDNASDPPATVPESLDNGIPITLIRSDTNRGAAARNVGAEAARNDWLCMLDDDSQPIDEQMLSVVAHAESDVFAIGADTRLPNGWREAGGLPEVPVGCGVLLRRDPFLELGGYDDSFGFYAEEYDLAARMILTDMHMIWDRRFRVLHRKADARRDMNTILRNIVRNSAWVEQRYAPEPERIGRLDHVISRYRAIAEKEGAVRGYEQGLEELRSTLDAQPRTPLSEGQFRRLTGEAHVRDFLPGELDRLGARRVALTCRAKHWEIIARVIEAEGLELVSQDDDPDALVAGSLSPGPMLDELGAPRAIPVVAPWRFGATSRDPARERRRIDSFLCPSPTRSRPT